MTIIRQAGLARFLLPAAALAIVALACTDDDPPPPNVSVPEAGLSGFDGGAVTPNEAGPLHDAAAGNDGNVPREAGGACNLPFGTSHHLALFPGGGALGRVYLDGQIDQVIGSLRRGVNKAFLEAEDFAVGAGTIVMVSKGGLLFQGRWPQDGPTVVVDSVDFADGNPPRVVRLGGTPPVLYGITPGAALVRIVVGDRWASHGEMNLPAGCGPAGFTQVPSEDATVFRVLANCQSGARNRVFTVTVQRETDGGLTSRTEELATLATDETIVAVVNDVWYSRIAFFTAGTKRRNVVTCSPASNMLTIAGVEAAHDRVP